MAGMMSGKVMRRLVPNWPLPSTWELSSSDGSMERSAPTAKRNGNGAKYMPITQMMPSGV
jgi:hypothetical protein